MLTGRTNVIDVEENSTSKLGMLLISHSTRNDLENELIPQIDSVIHRKPDLSDFWNVEAIGSTDNLAEEDSDVKAMQHFKDTVKLVYG